MSILESIIYGFVSGLAEFLPISSRAHQSLTRYIFGISERNPLQDLLVHFGILISIFIAFKTTIVRLSREQRFSRHIRKKRHNTNKANYYDLRLIKSAAVPLFICLFLNITTIQFEQNFLLIVLFLIINACVLLLAEHSSRSNKDAGSMTAFDSIILGVSGALSSLPGISRTGMMMSYAVSRGADVQHCTNWTIILSIPATLFALLFDGYLLTTMLVPIESFSIIIGYVLSGFAGFIGGYAGISFLQQIISRSGFSGFAYYSFGMSFLMFILYLIT